MATTKQAYNVLVDYSYNGENYTVATPTTATITESVEFDKVYNADGSGRGIPTLTNGQASDKVSITLNEASDSLVQAILNQQKAIQLGDQFDTEAIEGTLTLTSKADANDKLTLSYSVPSGNAIVPEVSESGTDRYALELRGRITQNFKGNI